MLKWYISYAFKTSKYTNSKISKIYRQQSKKKKRRKKGKEKYNHFTENITLSPTETIRIAQSPENTIGIISSLLFRQTWRRNSHIPKCKVKVHFFFQEKSRTLLNVRLTSIFRARARIAGLISGVIGWGISTCISWADSGAL